jgi:hypothetical protein
MRVKFVERENGPERLVCEAELVFDEEEGPLQGMKLVGFCLWRDAEGEVYVTFPRYFDYLRDAVGEMGAARVKGVKEWILREYGDQKASQEFRDAAAKRGATVETKQSLKALARKAQVSR